MFVRSATGILFIPALVACLLCLPAAPCPAADRDPWWGEDKALHLAASALLATDGYAATSAFTKRAPVRFAVGEAFAVAAGVAKEVYDRYAGGDPSPRDLTWDVVGATTGAMVSWLFDRYVF